MKGKQVCRFHGGRSTGPKTKEGRQRIREAHLIHGRYSKITKEHEAASKRARLAKEVWQIQAQILEKHVERAQALKPYFQALNKASSREEYGLLRMFLFGRLNQLVKKNSVLRNQMRELFEILFEEDALMQFEALTAQLEQHMCQKLQIPQHIWKQITPERRYEEYTQQLLLKVSQVWLEYKSLG